MAIADDISVAINGDIRYSGSGSNYTVLALKNFLGDLLDDAQASGDDLADITTDTIYERSTDQILTLNSPYNIDDTLVEHLYDGSITQNDGDDIYSGLYVVGVVESGTVPMIVQDNQMLMPYWASGINPDSAENVIMKIMVKSRSGGADINNQKVRVLAREFGDGYAEFDVTLGLANSVAAIFTANDLNNGKSDSTIEGYYGTIVNTEGFQELNVDGTGASGQEFYSKWDTGGQSLNDMYEFTKWIQQRSHETDAGTDTGTDYIVDNATITGQGQEFDNRSQGEFLVEMRFDLKIGAGTPTGNLTAELFDSDDASPAAPTATVLATSEPVISNRLTASYQEVIFRFTDEYEMTANQSYFAIIRHADGDASNYVEVDGAAAGAHTGNRAEDSTGWTGNAGSDLQFTVKACPKIHGIAGELFRGITHEIVYDGQTGTFTENEIVFWGTQITYDTLVSTFDVGEYVKFYDNATTDVINGGKILKDTGTILTVMLEDITGSILADGDHITGLDSGATADINTTISDDTKSGGEGILLANDDNTPTGELYIQLTTGGAPADDLLIVGRTSAATCLVNATVNSRTISAEFIGQSTGSNLIGAYGIGPDPDDVGSSDTFFDLSNTQRTPPNNVQFTVAGLVSGEDRVLVGPRSGTTLNKAQYVLQTTLDTTLRTAVVLTGAIQTETPSEGTTGNTRLRVELDTGIYRRQDYTSWSGSTFVIPSTDYTDPLDATSGNDVFVAYIDVLANAASEAFTAVHATTRDLLVRVRDGGATPIKTVEASAQFTGASQTVTINRVDDF